MKTTKKIFAVLIAFVLTLSMAIPAFAAGSHSITINNTTENAEYDLYQMATLLTDGTAYAYTVTPNWKEFFEREDIQGKYFNLDENGKLTAVDGIKSDSADMEAFGKLAVAYAKDKNITPVKETSTANGSSITFTNVSDGYYLVSSTVGTRAIVKSGSGDDNIQINEKNDRPTIDKEVKEGETYGDENDAKVGDAVDFKVTITAQPGAEKYIMHDEMDKGLSFNNDVEIAGLTKGTDYSVVTSPDDDCTFEIKFTQEYLDTIDEATKIVVTYSATLTEDAVDDADGIVNKTKLTYGEKHSTEEDSTVTKTHRISLLKYKGTDLPEGTLEEEVDAEFAEKNNLKSLAGAEFQLLASDKTTVLELVQIDDNNYRLKTAEDTANVVTSFVTNEDGNINIKGLDSGKYYLKEIKAPEAYNILTEEVEVIVSADSDNEIGVFAAVANFGGSELPSTGGIGTTIFYAVGGTLVVAAAVVLIVRRRMRGADEA